MPETAEFAITPKPDEKPKGKVVGAVVNAAKIMRFLRATGGPATVTQITRGVEINPSTCFNILRTLIQEDFVQFDSTSKTYQLSLGLVGLAHGALEYSSQLHILKPLIEELAHKHRMTAAIWRRVSDNRMMLVAAAESDAPIRIYARAGSRSPLLLGASGRVLTAYSSLDRPALKERFEELRLARPLDFETYLEQLDEVRRTGYAIDDGYVTPGTITIAVPVLESSDTVNFACAAILFNGQYDDKQLAAITEDVIQVGRAVLDSTTSAATPTPPAAAKRAKPAKRATASGPPRQRKSRATA